MYKQIINKQFQRIVNNFLNNKHTGKISSFKSQFYGANRLIILIQ